MIPIWIIRVRRSETLCGAKSFAPCCGRWRRCCGERRAWLYGRLISNAVDGVRICEEQGWDSSHMLRWLAFDLCELPHANLPWKSTRPGCSLTTIERECELICRDNPSPEGRIEYIEAMRDVVLARYQRNVPRRPEGRLQVPRPKVCRVGRTSLPPTGSRPAVRADRSGVVWATEARRREAGTTYR